MKGRLYDLLNNVHCKAECCSALDGGRCGDLDKLDRCQLEAIADHLIANGVIVLPCAVGDKVYWINRVTKEIETDIVIAIHQYEDGFSITTKTIGTKCTSTYSLNRFLEIMHFTKEEAEKALERSEGIK